MMFSTQVVAFVSRVSSTPDANLTRGIMTPLFRVKIRLSRHGLMAYGLFVPVQEEVMRRLALASPSLELLT
jgi:hypothetical protein